MCNNATVCGSRIRLEFFVSVWSDIWKSSEKESVIMFSVTLMCCEYRDVSLLMSVHTNERATASCDYALTGSKDAMCIHPSALELYVNDKMCDPCTILGWSCRWSLLMLGIIGGSTWVYYATLK